MSSRHDIQDATGRIEFLAGRGTVQAWGTSAPSNSVQGFAPGCIFHDLANGKLYVNTGTFASSTWRDITFSVQGVAAAYKLARGVDAITGTGTVVTGLTTVVAVTATAQTDPDGVALAMVSATIGDQAGTPAAGSVIIKTWKVTATNDATLIAATAAKSINWVAVGT